MARFRRALVVGGGGIGAALPPLLPRLLGTETTLVTRRSGCVEWRQQDGRGDAAGAARPLALGLDVMDERSVAAFFAHVRAEKTAGRAMAPFDLVVVATGGLEIAAQPRDAGDADVSSASAAPKVYGPERQLAELDPHAMMLQFRLNAIGPAMVLKHLMGNDLLERNAQGGGRGPVVAVLSARVGSIGDNRLGGWYAYRAAKAAVNQIVHTSSIEIARRCKGAAVVAYHPGTVETELTRKYAARYATITPAEAGEHLLGLVARLQPEDNGQFFDWKGERVPW